MLKLYGIIAKCQVFVTKKFFAITSERPFENRNWTFPVVHYFTWKLEFFSNILSVVLNRNSFLLLTPPRSLETWFKLAFFNSKVFNTVSTYNQRNEVANKCWNLSDMVTSFSIFSFRFKFGIETHSSLV